VRVGRSVFDLDADPAAVARTLERDPALRPLVEAHPGIRLPGAVDGFELAVRAIVGQQVSVAAARTMLSRIAARFGTPLEGPIPTSFPDAGALADAPLEELGIIGGRASAIRRVSAMVRAGADLSARRPGETMAGLEIDGVDVDRRVHTDARAPRPTFVWGALGSGAVPAGWAGQDRCACLARQAWRPWRAATMLRGVP
jgi:AraC family transcriptional regulator of adaptative response / DNA-3-methyladenine glycosylase II